MKNYFIAGNGLIDETEFLQWIGRIQALREETTTLTQDDDLMQDLVAAFRLDIIVFLSQFCHFFSVTKSNTQSPVNRNCH